MARRIRFLMIGFVLLVAGVVRAQPETVPVAPNVFLRGLQLRDQVRYTASFVKPTDDSPLRNVSVEITLPPDA
ncbi:MAG: hypothetical protein K8I30_14895, partial [Anaerolineae bacterium]|nr:hypothetical protein [Anaerolineae bacterium]